MNLKDRVIKKLLNVGKKHRLLVYPMLAVIAVISAISNVVYWGRGNGKKVIASLMVVIMLLTQSLFLTSSADENVGAEPEAEEAVGAEPTPVQPSVTVKYWAVVDGEGDTYTLLPEPATDFSRVINTDNDTILNLVSLDKQILGRVLGNNCDDFEVTALYSDPNKALIASEDGKVGIGEGSTYIVHKNEDVYDTEVNLYFSFKRTKYTVNIDFGSGVYGGDKTQYDRDNSIEFPDYCEVPTENQKMGVFNPEAKYVVKTADKYGADSKGVYKWGSYFNGFEGGYDIGSEITIGGGGFEYKSPIELKLKAVWTPMKFLVNYVAINTDINGKYTFYEDGDPKTYTWPTGFPCPSTVKLDNQGTVDNCCQVEKTFDGTGKVDLFTENEIWAHGEAYRFGGWRDDTAKHEVHTGTLTLSDYFYEDDITKPQNIKNITLFGDWVYSNVELALKENKSDKSVTVTIEDKKDVVISGTYGDYVEFVVSAVYVDGKEGSLFSYALDATTPADEFKTNYGLTVETVKTADGKTSTGYKVSGKLNLPLANNEKKVTFNVTDGNASYYNDSTLPEDRVTKHDITVRVAKKKVYVDKKTIKGDPSITEAPRKIYDGNDSIAINAVEGAIQVDGKCLPNDEVWVECNRFATLASVNASEELKDITLHNVKIAGASAYKYELAGIEANGDLKVEKVAKVDRCPISVTINGTDQLWYGEKRPELYLTIDDPTKLAGDASIAGTEEYRYVNASDEQKRAIIDELFKFNHAKWFYDGASDGTSGWVTERKQFSLPNKTGYAVEPVFAYSNYIVSCSAKKITVVQDGAVKGVDYEYSTDMVNGFYPGLEISPKGAKYDYIRLLDDDESDIAEDANPTEVFNKFKNSIEIDDCKDKIVRFQLLKQLDTGSYSISEIITVQLNVDRTSPDYVGHELDVNVKNLVNSLDFGTYFHKQNSIESIDITVTYEANYSPCDELHYYFLPEGVETTNTDFKVKMDRVPGTNHYTGTITVGTGHSGQLIIYATNLLGSQSVKKKIKIVGADDYDGSKDYYEWMVENNVPTISGEITVRDINGGLITDKSKWYNGLTFSASVKDEQSGVGKIVWKVTGPNGETVITDNPDTQSLSNMIAVMKDYGKVTGYNFRNSITSENLLGEYYISAIAYDNAGNEIELAQVGPYKVDCRPPQIQNLTRESGSKYVSNVTFEFSVTEGRNESGLDRVIVYDITDSPAGEVVKTTYDEEKDTYKANVDKNATYKVVAIDKAGNVSEYIKNFSGVSNVKPYMPTLNVTGTLGNDDWFKEEMAVAILNAAGETYDKVPVNTQYKVSYDSHYYSDYAPGGDVVGYEIPIPNDGIIMVEAWCTSESGVVSEVASIQIKLDTHAPEIAITGSSVDEYGRVIINYTVKDATSGVKQVLINDKKVDFTVGNDGVYYGSFLVEGEKTYTISATDVAGNTAVNRDFKPLSLVAEPITVIKPTTAHVEADIYKGTYEIDDYYVAYKKQGDKTYTTTLSSKQDTDYGYHIICDFVKLSPETVYDYKIYAITKTSKEVRTIEGTFKTSSEKSKAAVKGSVTYADTVSASYEKYPVYVSLYDGNVFVAGEKITDATDKDYVFTNLTDGTYRIVATDGLMSKTGKVVISNGGIAYPEDYLVANGVHFVLDGYSTLVVIEDNSINLAADGLDKVFDSIDYYEGVVTREDKSYVVNGGSIELALHAGYVSESNISDEELDVFEANMDNGEHIQRYITIYVIKSVRDASGKLIYTERVPLLYDDITISFPLLDLAGEKVFVAMAHAEKSGGYSFKKWDDESKVSITQNYVTISTNQFSTYALYTIDKSVRSHIVKWVVNGNVIKTEIVSHGSKATPPEQTPTKADDTNYAYKFGGWSVIDYSSVTDDMVISAWFTKIKKGSATDDKEPDKTATEKPGTTEKPGNSDKDDKDDKDKPDSTTERPGNNDKPTTTEPNDDGIEKEPVKDVYLGSDESPATGDEAPLVLMFVLMTVSLSGIIVMKKKK